MNIDWRLITKILNEIASEEDQIRFQKWLGSDPKHRELFNELKERWDQQEPNSDLNTKIAYADFLRKRDQLAASGKTKVLPLRRFINIAAAILILFSLSYGAFYYYHSTVKDIEMVLVATEAGQRRTVILADGTEVMLNVQSRLSFPKSFDPTERRISFEGEAFFRVAKDPKKPFIIESNGIQTKVLGTEFNLNSYKSDSSTTLTLVEGSVAISGLGTEEILQPEEAINFNAKTEKVSAVSYQPELLTGWMDNILSFENTSLGAVALRLERKYDIQIEFADPSLKEEKITGRFESQSLSVILHSITQLRKLDFESIEEQENYDDKLKVLIYKPQSRQ